jgi:hypothetical protein
MVRASFEATMRVDRGEANRSNGKHELRNLILLVDQPPSRPKSSPVPVPVLELELLQARLETQLSQFSI